MKNIILTLLVIISLASCKKQEDFQPAQYTNQCLDSSGVVDFNSIKFVYVEHSRYIDPRTRKEKINYYTYLDVRVVNKCGRSRNYSKRFVLLGDPKSKDKPWRDVVTGIWYSWDDFSARRVVIYERFYW